MSSKEWPIVRIDDICRKVTSGGTPFTRTPEYYGGSIPWLKTQEINFNRIYDTETKITEAGLNNSSAKWIPANSVIVAMYGATAGKVAINKIPLTTNQACCNLIFNDDFADYNYVYYNLVARFSEIASMAVGGAQQNLNAQMIRDLEIPLPPLPTQHRIATILSALDDKIELNRQTNTTLEAIAQTIFKEWFVAFRFPGATGEMQESKLGMIPQGWRVGKLGEIYKTTSGGTPSRSNPEFYEDGTICWVKSKELNNSFITETEEKITEDALRKSSAKLLPAYSVLIAMYGATVGVFGIISMEAACNQAICAFLPNDESPFTFIYHFLKNNKDEIISRAVGSAQQNISQDLLKQIDIVLPPKVLLSQFHKAVNPVFQAIESNIKQIAILAQIRDNLLPKLMSGEIEV